jgi:hypothetical protein
MNKAKKSPDDPTRQLATPRFFTTAFGFVTALDVILRQPVGSSAPESLQNIDHREGDP